MKIATLASEGGPPLLVVVSRDLTRCVPVPDIAPDLKTALANWGSCGLHLSAVAESLEDGWAVGTMAFDAGRALSPLPDTDSWLVASACPGHLACLRRAVSTASEPPVRGGTSSGIASPLARIILPQDTAADFMAGIAVVTDAVPQGVDPDTALTHVRLIGLTLEVLTYADPEQPEALALGLSPVLVTPDELGRAWRDGRIDHRIEVWFEGDPLGHVPAGGGLDPDIPTLIAAAARHRPISAGTLIGIAPVSAAGPGGEPARPVVDGGPGYASLAEARAAELILTGSTTTPSLRPGQRLGIGAIDSHGHLIYGHIDWHFDGVPVTMP